MNVEPSTSTRPTAQSFSWHDIHDIAFAAAWVMFSHIARHSNLDLAIAWALTMCYCIASYVRRNDFSDWKPIYRWTVGAFALASGVWLFLCVPTLPGRIAVTAAYAALYWFCDRTLQQRLREADIR